MCLPSIRGALIWLDSAAASRALIAASLSGVMSVTGLALPHGPWLVHNVGYPLTHPYDIAQRRLDLVNFLQPNIPPCRIDILSPAIP